MRNQSLLLMLRKLQAAQYRHDQAAHMDIAGLPVPQRVTHFTLHFSKYVGQLASACRQGDERLKHKAITDSFVIVLAAANAMNVDLQRRLEEGRFDQETQALELDNQQTLESLVLKYAEVVGHMSKACEAMDHMEDFPSRSVQERGVVLLASIVRRLAEIASVDLAAAARNRWKQIEQKPIAGKSEASLPEGSSLTKAA